MMKARFFCDKNDENINDLEKKLKAVKQQFYIKVDDYKKIKKAAANIVRPDNNINIAQKNLDVLNTKNYIFSYKSSFWKKALDVLFSLPFFFKGNVCDDKYVEIFDEKTNFDFIEKSMGDCFVKMNEKRDKVEGIEMLLKEINTSIKIIHAVEKEKNKVAILTNNSPVEKIKFLINEYEESIDKINVAIQEIYPLIKDISERKKCIFETDKNISAYINDMGFLFSCPAYYQDTFLKDDKSMDSLLFSKGQRHVQKIDKDSEEINLAKKINQCNLEINLKIKLITRSLQDISKNILLISESTTSLENLCFVEKLQNLLNDAYKIFNELCVLDDSAKHSYNFKDENQGNFGLKILNYLMSNSNNQEVIEQEFKKYEKSVDSSIKLVDRLIEQSNKLTEIVLLKNLGDVNISKKPIFDRGLDGSQEGNDCTKLVDFKMKGEPIVDGYLNEKHEEEVDGFYKKNCKL